MILTRRQLFSSVMTVSLSTVITGSYTHMIAYHGCLIICIAGSVTNLSGDKMELVDELETTLVCQIEPFNYNTCHRWYRHTPDGHVQVSIILPVIITMLILMLDNIDGKMQSFKDVNFIHHGCYSFVEEDIEC